MNHISSRQIKPPKKSGKETTARKILETVKARLLKIKAKHFHCVGVGNVPIQQPQHPSTDAGPQMNMA